MSDYDYLSVCEACGDAYTLGRLCRSCADQYMIDNAEADDPWKLFPEDEEEEDEPGSDLS